MVRRPREQHGGQQQQRAGLLRALRLQWQCLLLSSLTAGCLAAVAILCCRPPCLASPAHAHLYVPAGLCVLLLLYVVYLAECWHAVATSPVNRGLPRDVSAVQARARQLRRATPVVWWRAVCYHYVRRKRQVTRFRHGEAYSATQVYFERVDSFAARREFSAARCGVADLSCEPELPWPSAAVTLVRFSKGFAFSNARAAAEFEEQRAAFFAAHERRDDYMEMREGLDLPPPPPDDADDGGDEDDDPHTFRELLVAYPSAARRPWYCRPAVFWALSAVLLSWPLRLLRECNTAHVHVQVTKLFGVNYDASCDAADDEWRCDCEGRVDADVDSLEVSLENCALIPSYSEALLMDGTDQLLCAAPSIGEGGELEGDPKRRSSWAGLLEADAHTCHTYACRRCRSQLIFPSPLVERCPEDPFQGRSATTPTEQPAPPPGYEEALALPPPPRSLTDILANTAHTQEVRRCSETPIVSVSARAGNLPRPPRPCINMETSL